MAQTDGVPNPELLRELRRVRLRSQMEIANGVRLTQPQYSKVERGGQVLNERQWVEVAPLLAIDPDRKFARGRESTPTSLIVFLLTWLPGNLNRLEFVQDEDNQVAVYESGLDACRAAGVLSRFEAPCGALPATRDYATIDVLFQMKGNPKSLLIADSAKSDEESLSRSLDFVASALRRRQSPAKSKRSSKDASRGAR